MTSKLLKDLLENPKSVRKSSICVFSPPAVVLSLTMSAVSQSCSVLDSVIYATQAPPASACLHDKWFLGGMESPNTHTQAGFFFFK